MHPFVHTNGMKKPLRIQLLPGSSVKQDFIQETAFICMHKRSLDEDLCISIVSERGNNNSLAAWGRLLKHTSA